MSSEDQPSDQGNHQASEEITVYDDEHPAQAELIARLIVNTDFEDWYRQYQFAENIRNGTPYFNGPSKLKPPGRFSPSELLKCHRKIYYKHLNAPEENADPKGIFYFGNQFEEDLAEEFIADAMSGLNTYLRNSLWTQIEIDTDMGTIVVNGSTDPVVVDEDAEPILLSEIKTSSSLKYTSSPKEHHLAQAHAYMEGLSRKFDLEVRDVVFLYADRESLQAKTFHVEFDNEFWENKVVDWMERNTYHRVFGFLPPAEPEQEWECKFCPYKNRCGQSSGLYEDEDAAGFLPLYTDYPREKVVEYLEAHAEAKLTPSLAHKYPGLTDQHDVFDWQCSECDTQYSWNEISWSGDDGPECPSCNAADETGYLRGPTPAEQHHIEAVERQEEGST